MGLRDNNPMIDSDLELIITTFESSMVKSRDSDSVFVSFKRNLESFKNYPQSIVNSIDSVPAQQPIEDNSNNTELPNLDLPESVLESSLNSEEDSSDDEDWTEKVKNWVADCVPCQGEFKRTLSAADAEFFKDIGDSWDQALNESWKRLGNLENLLQDVDSVGSICELGNIFKSQCTPDMDKMIFILSMFLSKMEQEFNLDLGIFDSYLTAALTPVLNELAANLDLIDTLAIAPIKCVIDYMQYQINNSSKIAEESRAAIIDPIQKRIYEERARIQEAILRTQTPAEQIQTRNSRSESEAAAERARLEELRRQYNEQSKQSLRSATERANQAFNRSKDSLNILDKFQEYITAGTNYLEEKKEWLLSIIEELVNSGLDKWNQNMQFAQGKTDILKFISIMKAVVEASKSGEFSCGPETGDLTSEDIMNVVNYWQHPSESLEIIVEGDNIITRRRPDAPSDATAEDRGVITGVAGIDNIDNTTEDMSNIIIKRPISACLKKVTTDEVDQVHQWIRQLEDEV